MQEPRSVIVKTLVVNRKPQRVIEFFSNLKNWETGGAIKNVKKVDAKWWEADTPLGKARIRLRHNKQEGILDHDFVGGGGEWTVYCRITPNGTGSTATWLFLRPVEMTQDQFASQLNNFDKEIEGWKKALEALS